MLKNCLKKNADTEGIVSELKVWRQQNPSPFRKIAEALNPILRRFNLEVKTDVKLERPEDLYFIQIKNISGDAPVPLAGWSSGTKQVILTAAPFIQLDTWQTIVLIDEPERSLYPDTQVEIVKFYTGLAPDAQFFFATHSPIIASAFEPWEIVELEFNTEGKVVQKRYHDTKGRIRTVNDYHIYPHTFVGIPFCV